MIEVNVYVAAAPSKKTNKKKTNKQTKNPKWYVLIIIVEKLLDKLVKIKIKLCDQLHVLNKFIMFILASPFYGKIGVWNVYESS